MAIIQRREFIFILGGTASSWSLSARAQRSAMPVVGLLHPGSLATNKRNVAAFHQGLAEAGYTDGRNVRVEFRWADNQLGR
jgi:putative ABC transport system substrate-binding protein